MTDEEAAERLIEIGKNHIHDEEAAHWLADKLLVEILTDLGYTKTVEIYDDIPKWYA
jgi:hypothetical protein